MIVLVTPLHPIVCFASSSLAPRSARLYYSCIRPSVDGDNTPDVTLSPIKPPTPTPVATAAVVPATPSPAAPIDCSVATVPAAATPPPAAIASADIMPAATEPAAMPAEPNPSAPIAPATANGATVPQVCYTFNIDFRSQKLNTPLWLCAIIAVSRLSVLIQDAPERALI